jgi:hypothetical protein
LRYQKNKAMENLPIYIPVTFTLVTLLTVLLLYKASQSKSLLVIIFCWILLQSIISLSGFYLNSSGTPPRFILLPALPAIGIIILFITKKGRVFIDGFDTKYLTLLHIVRIPVELTLFWIFLHKSVPQIMTFEGRNLDILSGLSAPLIYYVVHIKKAAGKKMLLAWNILCLLLLINIVIIAILSAPFAFQKFGFEQPNIALFYFPYTWLPAVVVPAVLFAHLVSIRKLISNKQINRPIELLITNY